MKTELQIEGMSCQNCVKHVREALLEVEGVVSAEVTLSPPLAIVEHEGPVEPLIEALAEEGYPASERK